MTGPEHPVPTEDEFEEFIEGLLQVDPKGLSGKHHPKESKPESSTPAEDEA
jgi:hypothetical protein